MHSVLLVLFITLTLIKTNAFDECLAPPAGVVGPECKSANECTGNRDTYVTYTIVNIEFNKDGSSPIHCWGLGGKLLENGCPDQDGFKFIDLGIMGEGDSWDVYWGASAAVPSIKCAGEPLPAHITWAWGKTTKQSKCEGSCCGAECYNPREHLCCNEDFKEYFNATPGPVCLERPNPGRFDSCCGNTCCDLPHQKCCYGTNSAIGCYDSTKESCCGNRICPNGNHCCYYIDICCPNDMTCDKCGTMF
jgi:hypothetical protein